MVEVPRGDGGAAWSPRLSHSRSIVVLEEDWKLPSHAANNNNNNKINNNNNNDDYDNDNIKHNARNSGFRITSEQFPEEAYLINDLAMCGDYLSLTDRASRRSKLLPTTRRSPGRNILSSLARPRPCKEGVNNEILQETRPASTHQLQINKTKMNTVVIDSVVIHLHEMMEWHAAGLSVPHPLAFLTSHTLPPQPSPLNLPSPSSFLNRYT
ncbi:hypothetical protein E2C01_029546 [Portunus trituberculatus]|uniref:Uncharacterized protein n=1 Tax=Portunus trituberculatus TaxID=210409 RepID=A0A5B7ES47_PORTR|nr:hypothetical protein [Portunus trituberculatus]